MRRAFPGRGVVSACVRAAVGPVISSALNGLGSAIRALFSADYRDGLSASEALTATRSTSALALDSHGNYVPVPVNGPVLDGLAVSRNLVISSEDIRTSAGWVDQFNTVVEHGANDLEFSVQWATQRVLIPKGYPGRIIRYQFKARKISGPHSVLNTQQINSAEPGLYPEYLLTDELQVLSGFFEEADAASMYFAFQDRQLGGGLRAYITDVELYDITGQVDANGDPVIPPYVSVGVGDLDPGHTGIDGFAYYGTSGGMAVVAQPLGLDLVPDYWIDAQNGDDANDGSATSPWASLNKIDTVPLLPGETKTVRVATGAYTKITDTINADQNSSGATLNIVFEPGCSNSGAVYTAVNNTGSFFDCNYDKHINLYGNGMRVSDWTMGTGNGLAGYSLSENCTYDAHGFEIFNCVDGLSVHGTVRANYYDCLVYDCLKAAVAHIDSTVTTHTRCDIRELNGNGAASVVITSGNSAFFYDCKILPNHTRSISADGDSRFYNCIIGDLDSRTGMTGSNAAKLYDCFINVQSDANSEIDFIRCYGFLSIRQRNGGSVRIINSVIAGPASGMSSIFYSNYNPGSGSPIIAKNNIFQTDTAAAFMSLDATNASYLVAAGSEFYNNLLSGGAAFDADLIAADTGGTVIVDNFTADPLIGSADTLDPDDYGYRPGSPAIGAATDGGNIGFAVGDVSATERRNAVFSVNGLIGGSLRLDPAVTNKFGTYGSGVATTDTTLADAGYLLGLKATRISTDTGLAWHGMSSATSPATTGPQIIWLLAKAGDVDANLLIRFRDTVSLTNADLKGAVGSNLVATDTAAGSIEQLSRIDMGNGIWAYEVRYTPAVDGHATQFRAGPNSVIASGDVIIAGEIWHEGVPGTRTTEGTRAASTVTMKADVPAENQTAFLVTGLGPELVTNGDFSEAGGSWLYGTSWSYDPAGAAEFDGVSSGYLQQNGILPVGADLLVLVTFSDTTNARLDGVSAFFRKPFVITSGSAGTKGVVTNSKNANLYLYAAAGRTFKVQSVSVRQIDPTDTTPRQWVVDNWDGTSAPFAAVLPITVLDVQVYEPGGVPQ